MSLPCNRFPLMACLFIAVGCSQHSPAESEVLATASAAITAAPSGQPVQLSVLMNVGAQQNPLTATNRLEIGDRTLVLDGASGLARATNLGSSATVVGNLSRTGSIMSGAPVQLNGSRITGDVVSNGAVQLINGATVSGTIKQRANASLPVPRSFTVLVPASGGANRTVASTETVALTAGNWGKVTGSSGARIQVTAGTYYFDELTLEAGARIDMVGAPGELWLFVRNRLTMRGTLNLDTASRRSFVLAYLGSTAVVYEAGFDGAFLLAPKASLTLNSNQVYRGVVQAKDLIVRADATVKFVPPNDNLVSVGPPTVAFSNPIATRGVAHVEAAAGPVRVAGAVRATRAIAQRQVTLDGVVVPAVWHGSDFELSITPSGTTTTGSDYEKHVVNVSVTDVLGQSRQQSLSVKIALQRVPGQILARFNPEATQQSIVQAIASVGGSTRRVDPRTRSYTISIGTGEIGSALTLLRSNANVAYVTPVSVYVPNGLCGSGNADPNLAHGAAWHLDNDANSGQVGRQPWCEIGGNDCDGATPECMQGVCYAQGSGVVYLDAPCEWSGDCQKVADNLVCTSFVAYEGAYCRSADGSPTYDFCKSDADCSNGAGRCVPVSKYGACVSRGGDAYDIGWDAAKSSVCAVKGDPAKSVVLAVAESAVTCPVGSPWDGEDRCGLVDINNPDLRQNIWTNFLECCGNATGCPTDADGLPICQEGELTADGAPGRVGIDDDGDGAADFDDPDVLALISRLCTNRKDDDANGGADTCPTDGSFDPKGNRDCCNGEDLLANRDDDENGYIDDMHGVDFRNAANFGELYGSTFRGRIGNYWSYHATEVASVAGSTLDDGYGTAGVHPNLRIMTMGVSGDTFVEAMHYASANGARVVNMSFNTSPASCIPDSTSSDPTRKCTGANLSEYQTLIAAEEAKFRDAADPNVLYVISAGNDGDDMTLMPRPDSAGECPNGAKMTINGVVTRYCRWKFPANVGTYNDAFGSGPPNTVVVTATNNAGRFADQWQDFTNGANYGTNWSNGSTTSNAVDFAAPGDRIRTALSLTSDDQGATGTSFSAPIVAGVAAMLISVKPDRFDHQPTRIVERIRQTLSPCQAPAGSSRSCENAMQYPGFVDVNRALDFTNNPLPTLPLWTNQSYLLNDYQPRNSHDLDFVDSEGDGKIDFILEVLGGPFPQQEQPRLHRYDAVTGQFFDETASRLPNLVGNYNKSVVGDVDGDGCADFVLAGFFQAAPAPDNLKGLPNRLVLQNRDATHCLGTFRDATNEIVNGYPRLPTREDITRDVDLLDINGDHALDILFTNATLPLPGGNYGDQLLLNDGTGAFTDVSGARLPSPLSSNGHSAAVNCDVNGDGAMDIVQAVEGDINRLLINDGAGTYVDEAATRGFPSSSGFSHDVKCYDFTGDGYPEIIFGRRSELPNLYLVNDGTGHFTVRDAFPKPNTTQAVQLCDLDGDGKAEVLFGNGDIVSFLSEPNEVWRYNPSTGGFDDAAASLGFDFAQRSDLTEVMECVDMDGQGGVDAVIVGNIGLRNAWYRKSS